MSAAGAFDARAFRIAINAIRLNRNLLWKNVARQAGISPSTLTRILQGKKPSVDGFAALVAWGRLDANDFVKRGES